MGNNELMVRNEYNNYPTIIQYPQNNPYLSSPTSVVDLFFYQTRESLQDVDTFRNFLRNAESRFRASREYKLYKSYLIEYLGIDRCQEFGNIRIDDADIELHHNVIGLFDICLLIATHVINTIGVITTFDLIQLLIQEHYENRVGITFLCKTAHQLFTVDPNGYIPPERTFGRWWELLSRYKYGITYDLAYKIINYIKNYQDQIPDSINIMQQEEILNFSYLNEYGMPPENCGYLVNEREYGGYEEYGF